MRLSVVLVGLVQSLLMVISLMAIATLLTFVVSIIIDYRHAIEVWTWLRWNCGQPFPFYPP